VALGQTFPIVDEFGIVIAKAAFTSLELDPECSPTYGGEPPATGHYMFIGMSIETTADYYGEGSFTYPSAHDFDVIPAGGPTEGDVYPSSGSDLCLPDDKESFGFSTWTANGQYEGWTVIDTQHATGDLVFVPHFFTHMSGWKIAYSADSAAASTIAPAPPAEPAPTQKSSNDDGPDFEEPGGDGFVSDGLESACAQGTASREECFGPNADNNDNGVADANEYCDGTNSPDCIPRAYSPGTEGGEDSTSGEEQYQHGCEQGYIPPEEC
jgi:hypothetical protein